MKRQCAEIVWLGRYSLNIEEQFNHYSLCRSNRSVETPFSHGWNYCHPRIVVPTPQFPPPIRLFPTMQHIHRTPPGAAGRPVRPSASGRGSDRRVNSSSGSIRPPRFDPPPHPTPRRWSIAAAAERGVPPEGDLVQPLSGPHVPPTPLHEVRAGPVGLDGPPLEHRADAPEDPGGGKRKKHARAARNDRIGSGGGGRGKGDG